MVVVLIYGGPVWKGAGSERENSQGGGMLGEKGVHHRRISNCVSNMVAVYLIIVNLQMLVFMNQRHPNHHLSQLLRDVSNRDQDYSIVTKKPKSIVPGSDRFIITI